VTRSVRRLSETGWVADIAERKIGKLSRDWCNFADIIAIRNGHGLMPRVKMVQATGWTNVSSRLRKVRESEDAMRCIMAGCDVEVWGWDRCKAEPRVVVVQLDDFDL